LEEGTPLRGGGGTKRERTVRRFRVRGGVEKGNQSRDESPSKFGEFAWAF